MNDFRADDVWQKRQRDEILAPSFYKKYTSDGRFVFIDKGRLATILQKRYAVDTIAQSKKDGSAVCIQEKIVRWPGYTLPYFCLETESCTVPGHESPGWMHYCEADYLVYCFAQECGDLLCYLIEFSPLQNWFLPIASSFKRFAMETKNRTSGALVPIRSVQDNAPTRVYLVNVPVSEAAA